MSRRVIGYVEGRAVWVDEGPSNGILRASKAVRGELVTPHPNPPSASLKLRSGDADTARREWNRTSRP